MSKLFYFLFIGYLFVLSSTFAVHADCSDFLSEDTFISRKNISLSSHHDGHDRFVKNDWIYIPIVGDVHGQLNKFLSLISRLQVELGVKFPWVLQLGDLGMNQDPIRFQRWPQKNSSEINELLQGKRNIFDQYYQVNKEEKTIEYLESNILVVRGNHDFFLPEARDSKDLTPIVSHFYLIPDGVVKELELIPGEKIILGALGGVEESTMDKTRRLDRYDIGISLDALDRLEQNTREIDIMMTHQGPTLRSKGSRLIDQLLEKTKIKFHFHGHSHALENSWPSYRGVKTYSLSNLPFDQEMDSDLSSCYMIMRYNVKTKQLQLY